MDTKAIYRAMSETFSRELREHLVTIGKQLSNWLVAGNAAALAFTLSASINPLFPTTLLAKWIYGFFFVGLVSSFASLMLTMFTLAKLVEEVASLNTRLINNHHREHLADELSARGLSRPQGWDEQDQEDVKIFENAAMMGARARRASLPARLLSVLSMLCLAAGLSSPLFFLAG